MRKSLNKAFRILNRIVRISDDNSKGIVKYGDNNAFPQELILQLSESGTATACIEKLGQYMFADGLTDEEIGKTRINETQTFNELLQEVINYHRFFRGFALHISRTPEGKLGAIKVVPFEYVRKDLDGSFIYNPTFGKKLNEKLSVRYPAFKGNQISPELISPNGEILYFFVKKPGQYDYPIPSYFSAIEDINADSENSKYELESVTNSFLPSGILQLVGNYDDQNEDESGKTEWKYVEDALSSFTGGVKDASGASGRQSLLTLHAKSKEELAQYTPLANEGILNAIEQSSRRVAEKVARAFGVPPFLIGLGGNVGFSTNIIADNIELFNNNVKVLQEEVLTPFRKMFPDKELTLTQHTPIKFISPEILKDLTPAERRAIAGYETAEEKSTETVSLSQVLGVGGTQSLVEIVTNPALTPDQKKNLMQILFNISVEDANKIIETNGLPPTNPVQ